MALDIFAIWEVLYPGLGWKPAAAPDYGQPATIYSGEWREVEVVEPDGTKTLLMTTLDEVPGWCSERDFPVFCLMGAPRPAWLKFPGLAPIAPLRGLPESLADPELKEDDWLIGDMSRSYLTAGELVAALEGRDYLVEGTLSRAQHETWDKVSLPRGWHAPGAKAAKPDRISFSWRGQLKTNYLTVAKAWAERFGPEGARIVYGFN